MKKSIILATILMAFAAIGCSDKQGNFTLNEEEGTNIQVLHYPVEWDSSLYAPLVNDSIIEVGFAWSTGEKTPTITTTAFGEYEFTYTKVYASGTISSVNQLFVADSGVVIDPVIEVYYLWSTGDTTPAIDITEPGNYIQEETHVYASGICRELSQSFSVRNGVVFVDNTLPFEYNPNDIKGYQVYEWNPEGELTYIEYIETEN